MADAAIHRQRPGGRARFRPGAAAGRWPLRGVALLYLAVFILLPVAAIIQRGYGTGLGNLTGALSSFGAWNAIKLTLILAVLTAIINGAFGTLLAYVLVRFRFPGRSLLSTVVDLPFAIPTLVAGVMLGALYGPGSVVGGWLEQHGIQIVDAVPGILLALLFVTLPLVVRSVQPVLLELDPAEEEAARVLGAGQWTTFRKVVFPALRPAITAGSLQALARALGEFGAVVLVAGNIPNKTLTAPVFISQLLTQTSYGATGGPDEAAAVSALLFGLAFVIVVVTERVSSRGSGWLRT
ncbi:MAG TPA: sulfate ABC transporter permease subunit [Streptosporangiaceae bacterium]|nr:sulfate ABC transporter permease subunit [Streptosporangiaceae bacterium]